MRACALLRAPVTAGSATLGGFADGTSPIERALVEEVGVLLLIADLADAATNAIADSAPT